MIKKMQKIGSFYPDNKEDILNYIETLKNNKEYNYESKIIITPHAGYQYAGHAMINIMEYLEYNENIFIFAPTHYSNKNNIIISEYENFETPFENLEVNKKILKEIQENYNAEISNEAFDNEHSIEVLLPLLYNKFYPQRQKSTEFIKKISNFGKKIKIIPILIGNCDYKTISNIIEQYWYNSSFIISSDLSHFLDFDNAKQIDNYTATLIENNRYELLEQAQACCSIGIKGVLHFAKKNNFSMVRLEMFNSGDLYPDKNSVVGYGAWFLYENSKNDFLEKYHSNYILQTVFNVLNQVTLGETYTKESVPSVLEELGACFITFRKKGELRGCIGSVYPTRPLIDDIIENTKNAAFNDLRFSNITNEEIKELEISISILSSIEKINFKNEKDLLSKIFPYGIILMEKSYRSVYLPEVWEQLPDREVFFNSLKEKAGLSSGYFSNTMEVFKFQTTVITNY